MYAQTNIQLFNQLQREVYSSAELSLIRDAYELTKDLYSGYFIASGRTQIAHVVGTASILASLRAPGEVVAAGLLHNVYWTGDFGDGRRGITESRRRHVSQAVGVRVEKYVHRFPAIKTGVVSPSAQPLPNSVAAIWDRGDTLNPIDRQVLLIVLADGLDHYLNLEEVPRNNPLKAEIAEKLGFPRLAAELETAFSDAALAQSAFELPGKGVALSGVIAPRSYRRRLSVVLRPKVAHSILTVRRRLGQVVHRVSGLCASVAVRTRP